MSLFKEYLESSSNNLHNQFKKENKNKEVKQKIKVSQGETEEFYSDEYVEWLEEYCKFLEGTD